MIWNIPLLIVSSVAGALGFGWLVAEIARIRKLQSALAQAGTPASWQAKSIIGLRRMHRIIPAYLVVILALAGFYHAWLSPRVNATVDEKQWILHKLAQFDHQMMFAAGLFAALWLIGMVFAWGRRHGYGSRRFP